MSRLLVQCGEALYGPRWQSELARELGVSDRTVRRWVAGTTDVPDGLYVDLLRLTAERAALLDRLAQRLTASTDYGYAIDPRPAELGGGWRLRLLENGEEVGGGVFPLSPYLSADEANEREMAEKAAYEDALAEASAWLATRPV